MNEKGLIEGNDIGLTSRLMLETGDLCSLFSVKRYRTQDEKDQGLGFRVELDHVQSFSKA